MKEIAIYGKGGIGKSTLSANISAALSDRNLKILQIGCDPKHDSTRLLMKGKRITTVLDYIKSTGPLQYRLKDILFEGYNGIGCIEAGGPKPGVGCAGRGIITAFELLEKFHIKDNYDLIVYDVLGDVVCGGFAVPIRREYADTIFLVTSGEYMSLYAANNILRGIKNYDDDKCRVAGILYNSRNVTGEDTKVQLFAEAVGLPVFAKIPRDDTFALAEKMNCTISQLPDGTGDNLKSVFDNIACKIKEGPSLYAANPLTDEELEELIFGTAVESVAAEKEAVNSAVTIKDTDEKEDISLGYLSKNVIRDEPLHGCAFNGALTMSIHLQDAVILAHSPKSCTYMSYQSISSSGRRRLFERGTLLPVSISPNMLSSNMDESDMVFGGTDKLLDTIKEIKEKVPEAKAIVVISSCPSGIIGDDIDKAKALSTPDCPVVTIKADGNLTGDYLQGMLLAYTSLARQIIDTEVKEEKDVVNVVFEKVVAKNTEENFRIIEGFLNHMGIRVNCRFLCNTTYDALKNFRCASLNLLGFRDYTGKALEDFFKTNYDSEFYDYQFPVGFNETVTWIKGIGDFFHKESHAKELIETHTLEYERRIEAIKPHLQGKKLMIITYNHDLDWILRVALDAGMNVVKLCILNFSQDEGFRTAIPEVKNILTEEDYDRTKRPADIELLKPDIVLSNYESSITNDKCIADTIPMCPDTGFFSGLVLAERWVNLINLNLEGEWKNDKNLFNKYYSR